MKVVAGLGNPGREYRNHRHNVGFMVIERLAERLRTDFSQRQFKGELARGDCAGHPALLVKPQTFMNLSGECVAPVCGYYKATAADLCVVHDELDVPFGRVRVKVGGGHGGHNGLRSIAQQLGTAEFARVRVGVGRPRAELVAAARDGSPKGGPAARPAGPVDGEKVVGHVLSPFSSEERPVLDKVIEAACDAIEAVLRDGAPAAMNVFNGLDLLAAPRAGA